MSDSHISPGPLDVRALFKGNRRLVLKLAGELGLWPQSILHWKQVPAERLAAVSAVLDIPPEVLRPDLACVFAAGKAA